MEQISDALGFSPETAAVEWLETIAAVIAEDPRFAEAVKQEYVARDTIGWSKIRKQK